jgi:hypothetical protein
MKEESGKTGEADTVIASSIIKGGIQVVTSLQLE